jgi:hypothetical protein
MWFASRFALPSPISRKTSSSLFWRVIRILERVLHHFSVSTECFDEACICYLFTSGLFCIVRDAKNRMRAQCEFHENRIPCELSSLSVGQQYWMSWSTRNARRMAATDAVDVHGRDIGKWLQDATIMKISVRHALSLVYQSILERNHIL